MSLEKGKLGEENPSFQLDESVLKNSSNKYSDVDLSDRKYEPEKKGSKKHDDTDDMFEDKEYTGYMVGNAVEKFWELIGDLVKKNWTFVKCLLLVLLAILYNAYLIGSIHYAVTKKNSLDYCDDVGFLLIITIIVYISMFYFLVVKTYFRRIPLMKKIYKSVVKPGIAKSEQIMSNPYAGQGAYLIVLAIFAIFVFVDTADDPRRLMSAFGILVLIGLGFIFSKHPGSLLFNRSQHFQLNFPLI
jgi:pyrimidine nucleoside transport protein